MVSSFASADEDVEGVIFKVVVVPNSGFVAFIEVVSIPFSTLVDVAIFIASVVVEGTRLCAVV